MQNSNAQPLISVIIPVYNAKEYLDKCIETVLQQTYKDFELVLVDDGSTDGCSEICDDAAGRDARVRVIHKPNGGVSSARNVGLQASKGTYIAWLDSDDCYALTTLEKLIGAIQTHGVPIALCNYTNIHSDGRRVPRYAFATEDRILSRETIVGLTLGLFIPPILCANMIARTLYEGIHFPEGQLFEDVRTTYKIYERVEAVALVAEPLMFRTVREDSLSHRLNLSNRVDGCLGYIERYNANVDRWPQYKRSMLVSSARILIRLRDNVIANSREDYRKYASDLKKISAFYRVHTKDVLPSNAKLIYRTEYFLLTMGTRSGFFLSQRISDMVPKPQPYLKRIKTPDLPPY